jgi:NADH:ubiquinone oxidoreductase subunit H
MDYIHTQVATENVNLMFLDGWASTLDVFSWQPNAFLIKKVKTFYVAI